VGDRLRDRALARRRILGGLSRQPRQGCRGVIEADPIAAAVRALMAAQTEWTGTASVLLGALAEQAIERLPNGHSRLRLLQ